MTEPTAIDIPPAWADAIERIRSTPLRRVLVLGATDVGKSSFCRALGNALSSAGDGVALIDGDVGQKTIGPPTTIGLGYQAPGNEQAIRPTALWFVGATHPAGRFVPMVLGLARLAEAARAPFLLVNTVGLITGPGRPLAAHTIDAVQPDILIAIERKGELEPILRAAAHIPALRLEPSPRARRKSERERADARCRDFAAHFAGAECWGKPVDELVFQRTTLFTGVSHRREGELPTGFERNLLCGLADHQGRLLGLGIIQSIDFACRTIAILTTVPQPLARIVQFGDLYLAPDGRELGHAPREGF